MLAIKRIDLKHQEISWENELLNNYRQVGFYRVKTKELLTACTDRLVWPLQITLPQYNYPYIFNNSLG